MSVLQEIIATEANIDPPHPWSTYVNLNYISICQKYGAGFFLPKIMTSPFKMSGRCIAQPCVDLLVRLFCLVIEFSMWKNKRFYRMPGHELISFHTCLIVSLVRKYQKPYHCLSVMWRASTQLIGMFSCLILKKICNVDLQIAVSS